MPRYWQKLIAALVILLVAQGSLIASAPVVWCVGAGDHSKIEFGLGGGWHGQPATPAGIGNWHSNEAKAARHLPGGCTDTGLVTPASLSAPSKLDMAIAKIEFATSLPGNSRVSIDFMQKAGTAGLPPPALSFVQLAQLRTVFLLI